LLASFEREWFHDAVEAAKGGKSGVGKSGVSSSFLPEKMHRHRAKKLGRGG
jgi:hypothetical protein